MPLTNSQNVQAGQNQQPEYSVLWHPYGIDPASEATNLVPGTCMAFTSAGVGATPGPGGDGGGYTTALVDIAPDSTNVMFAGVLIGTTTLGQGVTPAATAPEDIVGFNGLAMCGVNGIMQVLCDNTTTIGDTLNLSSSTPGAASDSGGATVTSATIGVALQAVTISSGTALVWAYVARA